MLFRSVILIHPNVTAEKLRFLKIFSERMREKAWWGTLREFGDWWTARDGIEADVVLSGDRRVLRLSSPLTVRGLGIRLPDGLRIAAPPGANGTFVIDLPAGVTELELELEP